LFGQKGEIKVNGQTYNQIMPAYSFLTDEELANLISFVRNNFGNKAPAISAADIRLVRQSGGK